jgi:GTPase
MYEIGVADDGELVGLTRKDLEASIKTLKIMGERLRADVSIIRERTVQGKRRRNDRVYHKKNKASSQSIQMQKQRQQDLDEELGAMFLADDVDDDIDEGIGSKQSSQASLPALEEDEYEERFVAEVLVRKCLTDDQHFLEIRVAIVGGADAGSKC